jgi:hypothetical protein
VPTITWCDAEVAMPVPGDQVPWPPPPRDPGPWNGGPPVSPPGNTPLPPLPGAGGTMGGASGGSGRAAPQVAPQLNIPPDRPEPVAPAAAVKPDRSPVAVRVLAVLVVLAAIAGAAYVLLAGGREYPEAWDPRVAPVAEWVAAERGLDFDHPVRVNFLPEAEYAERATEGGGDPAEPDTAQLYADQEAQLRALGFLSGEVDLQAASDTLSDSGTLAFYSPSLEQVFVKGTELTPAIRVTLAHELVHVLQDQAFDLERLQEFDDGRGAVLRSLAEGDAAKVEEAYVAEVLTEEERAAYEEESVAAGASARDEIDASVPPILTTVFAAPYVLGPRLIGVLDALDGWDAINEALRSPPTEEALFDPLTWGTPALAPLSVRVDAPRGVEELDRGEFGPTTWYLLLASRIDPLVALAAVDGWGGDEYVVYRADDRVCVRASYHGDGAAETGEMAEALDAWVAQAPEGTASAERSDDGVVLQSCDPGADAEPVGDHGAADLLLLPVTRTDVFTQALEADRTPSQSRCYANGVVDAFTWDELRDPEGRAVNSPEGQQRIVALGQECFS